MTKSDGNVLFAHDWNKIEKAFASIGQVLLETRLTGSGYEFPSNYIMDTFYTDDNIGTGTNLTRVNVGGACDFYYTTNYSSGSYLLETGSYAFTRTSDIGSVIVFGKVSEFPIITDLWDSGFSDWSVGYDTATGIGSGIGGGNVYIKKTAGLGNNVNAGWLWYTGSDFYQVNDTIYLLANFSGYGSIANNKVQIRQDGTKGNAETIVTGQGGGYHLIKIRFNGVDDTCSVWRDGRFDSTYDLSSLSAWHVGIYGETTDNNNNVKFTTKLYFLGKTNIKNTNTGPNYHLSLDNCQNWESVVPGSAHGFSNTGSDPVLRVDGTVGSNVVLIKGVGLIDVS